MRQTSTCICIATKTNKNDGYTLPKKKEEDYHARSNHPLSNRLRTYLTLGHSVQIDGIGTLKPTFNAHSAETPEELGNECVYK